MVILDSMAFISHLGQYKYYLLGILNSNVIHYWVKLNVPAYGNTGYRLSNQFVTKMPIPVPDENILNIINNLVKNIIEGHSELENKLNSIIYDLYELTSIEVRYIQKAINLKE